MTIQNISMAEYLAYKALSSGMCDTILTASPLHAWQDSPWNPQRDIGTREMNIGTCAHAILLEGTEAKICVINPEEYRSKPTKDNPDGGIPKGWTNNAIREARDAALSNGLIPLLPWDMTDIRAMVKAAQEFIAASELRGIFDSGAPEQTLIWTETLDDGEIECKARPDWLTADGKICLSYKTTAGSANPDAWIRTQLPSYDVSTVFYERGVLDTHPKIDETRCVHLVQEQSAPYSCSLVALSPAYAALAERKLDRALAIWARCMASGRFPAYPSRICYAEPKAWQEQNEAEQAMLSDDELAGGIPA